MPVHEQLPTHGHQDVPWLDYMLALWRKQVLPTLTAATARRVKDGNVRLLERDLQVLYVECDACKTLRNELNEGEFDEGTFCLGCCPLAPGCSVVFFKTVAHVEALRRSDEGESMIGDACRKYCKDLPECDGTKDYCLRSLAKSIAFVQDDLPALEVTIRTRLAAF